MNVLGVQAVLVNSVPFHVLLVFGADDHDDEHRFLQDEAAARFCFSVFLRLAQEYILPQLGF